MANTLAPVLLLLCWLPPPQFQLPFVPLHHKSSLIQLLPTLPMLQLSGLRLLSPCVRVQLFLLTTSCPPSPSSMGVTTTSTSLTLPFFPAHTWHSFRCLCFPCPISSSFQGRGTGCPGCFEGLAKESDDILCLRQRFTDTQSHFLPTWCCVRPETPSGEEEGASPVQWHK